MSALNWISYETTRKRCSCCFALAPMWINLTNSDLFSLDCRWVEGCILHSCCHLLSGCCGLCHLCLGWEATMGWGASGIPVSHRQHSRDKYRSWWLEMKIVVNVNWYCVKSDDCFELWKLCEFDKILRHWKVESSERPILSNWKKGEVETHAFLNYVEDSTRRLVAQILC